MYNKMYNLRSVKRLTNQKNQAIKQQFSRNTWAQSESHTLFRDIYDFMILLVPSILSL